MVLSLTKKVARSFHLTICLLPSQLRKPIAMAYLLARLSDTIADEGNLSFSEREKILVFLKLVVEGKAAVLFLWKKSEQWKKFSQKEKQLIEQLPEMLELLQSTKYNAVEAGHIKKVWQTILEGQLMDLRIQYERKKNSADEPSGLEYYLYLVAGSVGEFLTNLIHELDPAFAIISFERMQALAIDYGKGLQLVNILRDFSHDQQQGRCYFLEEQKEHYQILASSYLESGVTYVNSLRPGRSKVAYALPLLLAQETLSLIRKYPNSENIKVSRWKVYWTLLKAFRFLFS